MKKGLDHIELSDQQLENEFQRILEKKQRRKIFRKMMGALVGFIAIGVVAVMFLFPIYYMDAASEEPGKSQQIILITRRTSQVAPGDVVVLSEGEPVRTAHILEVQDEYIVVLENMETISKKQLLGKVLCYIVPTLHGESNR